MLFRYSFKHMDVSPALKRYAETKLQTVIRKFVTKPIEAHLTFSVDRHLHKVHVALTGGDGFNVQTEHTCEDMYGSVDHAATKLTQQLKRKKDILKGHKGKTSARTTFTFAPDGGGVHEDAYELDAADIIKYETARKKLRPVGT